VVEEEMIINYEKSFCPQQDSNSYFNLKKRMLQKVQEAQINDQIFEVVQKTYDDVMNEENIILSRQERKRLLAQILKSVLEDMVKKLGSNSTSA
jgi:hypothetical protein